MSHAKIFTFRNDLKTKKKLSKFRDTSLKRGKSVHGETAPPRVSPSKFSMWPVGPARPMITSKAAMLVRGSALVKTTKRPSREYEWICAAKTRLFVSTPGG